MSRAIYTLQAIAFLDLFAVGLIIPLIAGHVRQMGANHIFIGLLGSTYAAFQLGSGPVIGSLSDLKGRKTILILTLILCSIAYTLIGLVDSIFMILIIRAFLGLFKQTQILTKALVPTYENDHKIQSEIYGKLSAISGVGMTTGPIIGGHIAEDFPQHAFTFVAILVGLCFLLNAGLTYSLPNTRQSSIKKKKTTSLKLLSMFGSSVKQSVLELYKIDWKQYWQVFLFKGLVGFTMGIYFSNYVLYLKTVFALSPKYVGYVISFQGVVGSISSYFIGYINSFYTNDNDYTQRNFHVFLLLAISLGGLILSWNVYVYVLWLIPLAIGNAVGRLVTLEMVLNKCDRDHIGTLMGAASSVRSLTGVISPMVAGFIGQYVGVTYVVCASLSVTLFGTILSYHVRNKKIVRQKKE